MCLLGQEVTCSCYMSACLFDHRSSVANVARPRIQAFVSSLMGPYFDAVRSRCVLEVSNVILVIESHCIDGYSVEYSLSLERVHCW